MLAPHSRPPTCPLSVQPWTLAPIARFTRQTEPGCILPPLTAKRVRFSPVQVRRPASPFSVLTKIQSRRLTAARLWRMDFDINGHKDAVSWEREPGASDGTRLSHVRGHSSGTSTATQAHSQWLIRYKTRSFAERIPTDWRRRVHHEAIMLQPIVLCEAAAAASGLSILI
jgi:hypothetical protein